LKGTVNNQSVVVLDQQAANDCIPRPNEAYTLQIQHEIEGSADAIAVPGNNFSICSGRPFTSIGILKNYGLADLSNLPVRLTIYKLPGRTVAKQVTVSVSDLPYGQQTAHRFDPMSLNEPGQYEAELHLMYDANTDPI